MGSGLRINTISWHGAYIFRVLGRYAENYFPSHPQVYQVDELYILHTAKGGTSYVIPPTTADAGLRDTPPKPLPIDLFIAAQNNLIEQLDSLFASGKRQVWLINAGIPSLSVYDGRTGPRTYQPGDIYTDEKLLPGFSLDISDLFGVTPDSSSRLSLEDQSLLRLLLYPVILEPKPLDALKRVIAMINENSDLSPDTLLNVVQHALASDFSIGTLLPFVAPENEIRAFLQELSRHLSTD